MKAIAVFVLSLLFNSLLFAQTATISNLSEAEQVAIQRDYLLMSIASLKQSKLENSQAALHWQDPALKFGISNLPVDTFSFDQEAMTQLKVGIVQQFPQGDSLEIQSRQFELAALEKDFDAQLRIRQILKSLRLSWLEVLYQEYAYGLLQNNYQLFEESRDLIELNYASGRGDQQDIYQTELELSLLQDKLDDNRMKLVVALDALKRWLGVELEPELILQDGRLLVSDLTMDVEQQQVLLLNHPSLIKITQLQGQAKQSIKLSQQKYKPAWAMDLSYGLRFGDNPDGSNRSDFFSTGLSMKYPLWGTQKHDHKLAASEQNLQAVSFNYEDKKMELQRDLLQTNSQIQRLLKRINNYDQNILDKAAQNAQAALNAYQAGVGGFNELVRSNVTQLNIELAQLKLKIELARQYVNLAYLLGDKQ